MDLHVVSGIMLTVGDIVADLMIAEMIAEMTAANEVPVIDETIMGVEEEVAEISIIPTICLLAPANCQKSILFECIAFASGSKSSPE